MPISCIIPTCDRPEFLLRAVNSVLGQTVPPDEIIIVNNGKERIALPAEIKKRVKIYDITPYAGASRARNFGARAALGNYLAFLDDDDQWNRKYLENALVAINKGAQCILSRIDLYDNGKLVAQKNPHGKITIEKLLVQNPGAGGSNLVIKKDLFFAVGGFDEKLPTSEDKALVIEIIKKGMKIVTLPLNHIIASRDAELKRLTDAGIIAAGIYQFTKKYQGLMAVRQRLQNWLKIYHYRFKAGDKRAIIPFIFLYAINKAMQGLAGKRKS